MLLKSRRPGQSSVKRVDGHLRSQAVAAAGLRWKQDKLSHRLVVALAEFAIKLGSSLQHLDPYEKQVTYEH